MSLKSLMFVAGNSEKHLKKAGGVDTDAVIIDLEDAVAPEDKDEARRCASEFLETGRKRSYLRINAIETSYFLDDLSLVWKHPFSCLKGIMLPKTNDVHDLVLVDRLLDSKGVGEDFEVIPLLETAAGIQNVSLIAAASKRVKRLAFGSIDFALDIGADQSESGTELLYARSAIVVASKAAGLESPIDTVYPDFKNTEGLREETRRAKILGFGAKLAIHPNQIPVINQTFQPSQKAIEEAKRILEYVEKNGSAVFKLDGKMIDEPIIKQAKLIVNAVN